MIFRGDLSAFEVITVAEIPLVPPFAKGETQDLTADDMQSEFVRLPCSMRPVAAGRRGIC